MPNFQSPERKALTWFSPLRGFVRAFIIFWTRGVLCPQVHSQHSLLPLVFFLAWAALDSLRRKAVRKGSRSTLNTSQLCKLFLFGQPSLQQCHVQGAFLRGCSPIREAPAFSAFLDDAFGITYCDTWACFRAAVRKDVVSRHNLATNPTFQADAVGILDLEFCPRDIKLFDAFLWSRLKHFNVIGRTIRRRAQSHSSSCARNKGFFHPLQRIDGRGSGKICYPMSLKAKGAITASFPMVLGKIMQPNPFETFLTLLRQVP